MSNSIFGDLDVASAIDPFEIADGTYKAVTGGTKVQVSEAKGKKGLAFTYTIDDPESPYNGRKASEWKNIPKSEDKGSPEYDKDLGYLKQRLASLGVPESKMNSIQPEELDDIPVVIVVKNNPPYVNVQRVSLREDAGSATSEGNPFE